MDASSSPVTNSRKENSVHETQFRQEQIQVMKILQTLNYSVDTVLVENFVFLGHHDPRGHGKVLNFEFEDKEFL